MHYGWRRHTAVEAVMSGLETDPVLSFRSVKSWEAWLAKNHAQSGGVWLRIFKKDSGEKTVTYAEALEGALCYGWIDGLKRPYDSGVISPAIHATTSAERVVQGQHGARRTSDEGRPDEARRAASCQRSEG